MLKLLPLTHECTAKHKETIYVYHANMNMELA